jgi:hypothetical protein
MVLWCGRQPAGKEVIEMAMPQENREAHVELTTDDEPVRHLTIPAGPTGVVELKVELSVPATDTLFQTRPDHRPLDDHETVDVKSGDAFEAIGGGGVS